MDRHGYGRCGCGSSWTGYDACHCTNCHDTFTGVLAFDRHRVRGRCQDPAERGLVKVIRPHWVGWCWPGRDV